jgi:hypothetical protein
MGREFIGECPVSDKGPEVEIYEGELAIKYIKQECGQPPEGVDVQITSEGSEVGDGSEQVSYPIISVVWDEGVTEYPDEYIAKCIEAFEKFDLPEEIYQGGQERLRLFCEANDKVPESDDPD